MAAREIYKDKAGNYLFVDMVDVVRRDGAGFVDYLWPKPGFDAPVAKVSYVKGFKPWAEVLDEFHAHLDANEIDPKKADIKLGAMLEIDPKAEALTGASATAQAKALWTGVRHRRRFGQR